MRTRAHGRKLMTFVEDLARKGRFQGDCSRSSTQAFVYLQQKGGFHEADPDALPAARREKYEQSGRHSKVLVKSLMPPAALGSA